MKHKFLLTILPLFALLTGCNQNQETGGLSEKALDAFPVLLNYSTGKEVFVRSDSLITAEDYDSYLGLNSLTWKEQEFELSWEASPADKWSIKDYSADPTRVKFMPLYGEEQFECSLTLNISVKGKNDSASRTWNFKTDVHNKPDLTEYTYTSIESLITSYAASPSSGASIYTFGTIVATMEPTDNHLYSGVFVQDGKYGAMMYAGQLSKLWFAIGFEVGDRIMIAGTTSDYSGLLEITPKYLEYADSYLAEEGAPVLAEPEINDLTEINFTKDNVNKYQSSLIKIDGLKYDGVKTALAVGTHGELKFKQNSTDVLCYVNYHIGSEAYTKLIEKTSSWVVGQTTVNFVGIMSYYGDVQIFPVYGADSFTVVE